MFTSALDHCIRFIGVHPEGVGCTSGALGDFICYDVLPFCGWAPNATLCDAVVTLILRERPDDVAVCRCAANEPNMRLTSDEALALLAENSNRVQWTDDSTNSSTDDSLWTLTFSPSPSLREEVLGVKLHTESRRGTSNYMSESAVHGVDNLLGPKGSQPLASDEDRKKYKPHTITNGLKWMRNMRLVTDCYLFDPSTKTLMCRTFPSYAAPLSEVEKPLFYVDANVGPLPTERAQQRCNYPLNHYFERKRRASATFPSVVFDLSLIRYVVKSSPDRKLLLPDAIHAVFASHNFTALDWSGMGKIDRSRYRRMLNSAGLSVVVAKVDFRGRLHAVRLVVPEEDLAAHLAQGEQSEEPAASEGEEDEREEGDLKMEPDDDTPMTERKVIDTCEKLAIANRPLFVAPQYPLLLQAVREAEARPLALTSVYPDMLLYGEGMKPLLAYFGAYSKTRQTLKSSYMRAKNSRAFTLVYERKHGELEAPPKVSPKLDSPAPETSADKLPSGLSEYSVNLVLDALRSAPHQALTLNKLSTMVDLTLLRRKILPYLRSSNQVDTTGYSPKGKRRVGIITLNGVSLSESTMARIIESEAKEKELSPTMAKASHMVQTKLVLQRLPAMVEGSSRSTEVERLLVPGRRSQKLVSQLIMVRNGFSRNSLYRAGRLHLELWKQLFDGDQLRRRDVSWEDKATLTARHVLEHMSLSTFCIVIGLPTVDLGSVLKYDGQWGTPMCDQPPTIQAWCRSQGTHTLLHSLGELQERGLIKSSRRITAVMWTPLDEIDFVVSDHCQLDEETGILYAPHYTPSSTAYMCLLFWRPLWNAVSHTHAILRHVTSIYNVDSNISIPRMVALARLLRMDHSLLAEALYQSCGMRSRRNKDSTALEDGVRTHLPAMRDGRRRRTKIHRSEVSVATVFGKIQNIFRDGHPTRRLKDLLGFLGRTRRNALIAANLVGDSECESTAVYNRRVNRSVSHLGVLGELVNRLSSRRVPGGSATSATVDERSAAMATFAPDASSSRGQPTDIFAKEPDEERVKATEARVRRLTSLGERHEDVKLTSDRNEFEMVLDIMRMILLSDRAHYNATTAREVLLQFPSPLIRQARAYLQRQPAFCRGGSARSRIADLSLSAGPRFLVGSMSRDCLRPCANTSLLHQWIYTSDRAAVAQTTSPQHRLCIDGPLRTETEYEVVVTQRPPVLTDQLTGSKRVDERMLAGLRIPTLAWPSNAASLEKWSTAREERLRVAAQRRKRQREDDADGEGDEAADDEEEDDAVHVATTDGVALQLYPARSLTAHIDHYALLHNIPTDAPPTTAELHAVTRQTSKEVKAVPATRQGTLPLTAPIEYPSPFHHVDGAFHRYAWNSFLMAVYELVLQLPGISDTELTRRLLLSGLVSSRAVRAGIEALIHSGVLVRESVRSTLAPEASPYSMQASCARNSHSLEYAYKATIPLEGLWSTIETFC